MISRRTTIALAVAWTVCAASRAEAHDPGLSFATVAVTSNALLATMRFHDSDLVNLADTKGDPLVSPLAVRAGDSTLEALRRQIRRDDDDHTTIELVFAAPGTDSLEVIVPLLESLPRGHKHHIEVRDSRGTVLANAILSAGASAVHVNGTAASIAVGGAIPTGNGGSPAAAAGAIETASWFAVGIEHILEGYDHLLFVFALLLGAVGIRDSVRLITAFTVGHSLSLALAVTGLVRVPGAIVEPVIAASIVVVALLGLAGERNRHGRLQQSRAAWQTTAVTFGFGLVHGLGFASVIAGAGIDFGSPERLAWTLLAFNLGVEAGQLAFALPVLAMLVALRHMPGFRRHGLALCSTGVAACGAFWFVERVTGG